MLNISETGGTAKLNLAACCTIFAMFMMTMSGPPASAQPVAESTENQLQTVTIGLRGNLGNQTEAVKKAILRNPAVRVGWPSEYEIASLPDYPRTLVLIDMQNSPPKSLKSMYVQDRRDTVKAPVPYRFPVELGKLDDGSFVEEFNREIRKILRVKSLVGLKTGWFQTKPTTCVYFYQERCEYGFRERDSDLPIDTELSLEVRNQSENPKFLSVLHISPEHDVNLVLNSTDVSNIALPSWAILTDGGKKLELKSRGRHRFVTISSDTAINSRIFTTQNLDKIDPTICLSDVEKILCDVLSGKRREPPSHDVDISEVEWTLSVLTHYVPDPPLRAVGGGSRVPFGYANWQVQIYSTQRYTPEQIKNDTTRYLKEREEYELYHRCGGSLIARNIVLTAAHCVAKAPFSGDRAKNVLTHRRIRAGTLNIKSGGTTFAIDSIVVHKGYVGGKHPDDIAIIRIKSDHNTEPAHLDTINYPTIEGRYRPLRGGKKVRVLGWGVTGAVDGGKNWRVDANGDIQHNPNYLMIGDLQILNWKKCKKRPVYSRELGPKMICAVSDKRAARQSDTKTVFSCVGDSGGPVIREFWTRKRGGRRVLTRKEQIGIVSWAYGCGTINPRSETENPSVFVDVAQYAKWIDAAKQQFISGEVRTY